MILTRSGQLHAEFTDELESVISGMEQDSRRLAACIRLVRAYLMRLRKLVEESGFSGPAEEIRFFKEVKPRFYQWLVFHAECFALESCAPATGAEDLQRYYKGQLTFIDRFFTRHAFHYQYYKLGGTEMDHLYFIRGAQVQDILIPEVPEVDPAFGTKMEYLFAQFMARERLREHIAQLMHVQELEIPSRARRKGREMKWTGETSNLIELAYGIYEMRQINEGKADIGEIISWLEESFGVSLHRYYRRFSEIKRRKTISKTRFLDDMQEAVARRIEDGDAYKPREESPRTAL